MPLYSKKDLTELDAIICLGQSNEEGGGTGTPSAQYLGNQNNVYTFYKPDASSTDNGAITQYYFGVSNSYRGVTLGIAGPDISVGYSYNQSTGKPLLIIKYALGGSILVDDGVSTVAAGKWQIGADPTRSNNLVHFNIALNNFIIPCILKCQAKGIKLNIKAGFWCQGEADSTVLYCADNYQSTFIQLWDGIISTLTPYGILSPNFKPVITRIHNNFTPGTRPYLDTVRTALVNVANHYNSYWIDTDAYPVATDLTHWTAIGQQQHGIDRNTILQTYFI
jgi:hypothetical protein